ncbi:MAG: ATPase, T2SS/T4P/T4SS family [SAR324 cluster bacterium]|nr:ATPase, T2SS/T4P/T4SS family [SAR324 cluster bacterium]
MSEPTVPIPSAEASLEPSHPLLSILVREFHLAAESLEPYQEQLDKAGQDIARVKQILLKGKVVTEEIFQQGVARLFGLEYQAHLDQSELLPEFTSAIPIRYAKKFVFFPTRMTDDAIWVAVENPQAFEPVDDVGRKLERRCHRVVSTHQAILSLINRAYDRAEENTDEVIEAIDTGSDAGWSPGMGLEEPEDLLEAHDEEPIKRLLNNALYQAAKSNASDVHIEATPTEVVVRFRVDGVLHLVSTLPKAVQLPLINRVKIMSRLDISQHGLPQDGRTLILIAGRKIDIRVSTLPTVSGEKAVLRLLYQDQDMFSLTQLGMPKGIYADMRRLIRQSGGIILVSGPTGSGKTTTLYAALSEIDRHSKNILTIEDPVEYKIAGYVQTEVNPKLGLTFATALRSVLRQDPDVIMVGEMRDQETALIAIQAALTGHTVFSTVHTNDAPSTMTRLVDMGIQPYLVSSTVVCVLAQRLLRRICTSCKVEVPFDPALLKELGLTGQEVGGLEKVFKGEGCSKCRSTGFRGRVGLFELLIMNDAIKKILLETNEANQIRKVAQANGMISMRQTGIEMVKRGETTVDELISVTRED